MAHDGRRRQEVNEGESLTARAAVQIFHITLFLAAVAGGVIAAISGFGIGSILTPAVSTYTDTKLAVAIVYIPHFVGTLVPIVRLRRQINRSLALSFGIASAIGGLTGSFLNASASVPVLCYLLATLMAFSWTS